MEALVGVRQKGVCLWKPSVVGRLHIGSGRVEEGNEEIMVEGLS